MKKNIKKLFLTFVFFTLILSPLFAKSSYKFHRDIRKTYDVKPGMKLSVSNRNGKIQIEKWDKDQVDIFARIRSNKRLEDLNKIDVDINVDADINISTKFAGNKSKDSKETEPGEYDFGFWDIFKKIISPSNWGSGAAVDYQIKVPDYIVILYAKSTNGEIELKGTKGPTETKTTNGAIKIFDVDGNIEANSTNGRIEIKNVNGFVSARTTNGKIKVKSKGIKELKTTNGSIEADFKEIKETGTELRTTNGSISLGLAPSLNATVELKTTNGGIDIDDIPFEVISKHKKKYIKGKIGKGGPEIRASTTNGSIKIRKL